MPELPPSDLSDRFPMTSILMAHPGAELYGSDRVFLESARALAAHGWNVTVVLAGPGPLVGELGDADIRVVLHPTGVIRKSAMNPRGLLRLAADVLRSVPGQIRTIRSGRFDVVYVSTLTIPSWLILGRLAGSTTVCHVHEAETAAPDVVRRTLALPLLAARGLVFNSRFAQRMLTQSLSRAADSDVILNPLDGPGDPQPAREQLTPPLRILFVGRLSERKGPQVLVRALEVLRRGGTDAHLELLGAVFDGNEGFEQDLRDEVRRRQLDDHVTFSGFVPDVWPSLERSDIVVVPSTLDETFGNAAVEAVLAARPVVVSRAGGLPEAIDGYRSARVVPVDDPTGIADAVSEMSSNWDRVRLEALDDASTAAVRHSSGRYAEELDATLRAAARRDAARRRRTST